MVNTNDGPRFSALCTLEALWLLLDFLPLIFYRGELEVWLTAPTIAAGQRGMRHVINEVWSFAVDFPCLRFVIFYF